MRLEGKTAIITGAGSGIGQATAMLFAREGAHLVLADINQATVTGVADTIQREGGQAIAVAVDVTKASDIQRMVQTAMDHFRRIDVLFNNAGIIYRGSVLDLTEEEWDNEININLKGVFLGCKFAIPRMLEGGGGSIINTASGSALIATKNSAAYCASKGGVLALTRSVALDYAPTIRVNAICPGVVDTPAMHRILAAAGDVDTLKAERGRSHPLGRLATPEEIAYGVLYLAADESSFTTGSPLIMDGGYTAQ
ncbi:MAG: SDR family NAD(P)-dependent oxidoreductase [Thermomicrobiales bacterium]